MTHEEALHAAGEIAEYCGLHWNATDGECCDCIFQKGKRNCRLKIFLGFFGNEMQMLVDAEVRKRCKELTERQKETR